jgi:hypothetical protein
MRQSNLLSALVLTAGLLIPGLFANIATAQERPQTTKPGFSTTVLLDNEKVRVFEAMWKPGSESPSAKRPPRVVRVTTGGTLSYIYADGRIEKITKKTGDVYYVDADPVAFSVKNESEAEVVLMNMVLK